MGKHGKKYREHAHPIDRQKLYGVPEGVAAVKQAAWAKFPESVDLAVKLGLDFKKGSESVRGTVVPPHGTGKTVRVAVITKSDKVAEAEQAGADVVGAEDLIEKIKNGFLDFDVLIATPEMMGQVGRLGKILGGKGLMPNPKSGTVSADVGRTAGEFKKGKFEFRMDKTGVIHIKIGSVTMEESALGENLRTVMEAILRARPSSAKGDLIKSISISTSMGPGVRLDPREFVRGTA